MHATIDFETRSLCDLRKRGTAVYARDPSTSVLCMAWGLDDAPVQLWHPAVGELEARSAPAALFAAIEAGALVEAHNVFFERNVWEHVCRGRYGWPAVPAAQWRCSLAKAATFALPKRLEHAAAALGLRNRKDAEGHKLMMRMTRPRKPSKKDPSPWHEKTEQLERLFAYCRQDVETERELSKALRDLPPTELAVFQLDQEINLRGIHIDRGLAEKAIALGALAERDANAALFKITAGAVGKPTDRAQMKRWLKSRGVQVPIKINSKQEEIETTEAKGFAKLLQRGEIVDPAAKKACETWIKVSKSSPKKYKAMLERIGLDDRALETLAYHTASTGRWGGRGIQPQNLYRPTEDLCDRDGSVDTLCADILGLSYDSLCTIYGQERMLEVLGSALRGAITASPGKLLQASDLSAIETRGAAWLANDTELLEVFRTLDADPTASTDVYCWQASQILGRPITKKDKTERQNYGKVPTLGCVYQMGGPKLKTYAESMGVELTEEFCIDLVEKWRAARTPIVRLWADTQAAAQEAVRRAAYKDRVVRQGDHIRWKVAGRFLHCRLPSGRLLSYLDPAIQRKRVKYTRKDGTPGEFETDQLVFSGENTYTRRWERCSTYSGKLVENLVQAICRDILAEGMLRVARAGYDLVLTVHDEIVAEVDPSFGSTAEFERLMAQVPTWAPGFPVACSGGWRGVRYRK